MKGEWKRVKLGEVCSSVCSGGTPKSSVSEFYGGEIPWLNTKEVRFEDIWRTEHTITELGLQSSSAKWVCENSVVVAMYGATAGNAAIVRIPYTSNQACCNLTIEEKQADYRFIYYSLKNNYFNLAGLANGGAQQNLNAQIIKDFEISLPPLPTQRRIAAVLGALDDKIELNRKMNVNLEAQAQALFKSWFVDFEPWGGKMPAGWKMGKAEDFYDISIGKTPPRKIQELFSSVKGQNETWVSIADMGNAGVFIEESSEYLIPSAVKGYNVSIAPKDSVLLSFKLTVGRVCIASHDLTTNEAIAQFKPSNGTPKEYTYLYLKNFNYDKLGSTSSIATAVNSKMIKAMAFVLPAADTLADFAATTKPLFDCILNNQRESRKLAELRDALLPKLMSGELEVA